MLKFKFTLTGEDGKKIEFEAGRSSLWKGTEESAKFPASPVKNAKQDYAWVYFAAKQRGKLADLGVDESMSLEEAIEVIADNFDYDIQKAEDDAPLASAPAK